MKGAAKMRFLVPHSCYDDPPSDVDCSQYNYTNCPEIADHYLEENFQHGVHCPRSCGYCPLLLRSSILILFSYRTLFSYSHWVKAEAG